MQYIEFFKASINNPQNIKGFHTQLNPYNIKDDIDIKEIELAILGVKIETKIDTHDVLNRILSNNGIEAKKKAIPTKTLPRKGLNAPIGNVVAPVTANKDVFIFSGSTIEEQMAIIKMENYKSKIRTKLKDLVVLDANYDTTSYINILSSPDLTLPILVEILKTLEDEVSSYEGRSLVADGIVVLASIVEGIFDGSKEYYGHTIDLTGIGDTLEHTLRKRKGETGRIHAQITESLGLGDVAKLGVDILVSSASTYQKNKKGTSNVARAIKKSENSK